MDYTALTSGGASTAIFKYYGNWTPSGGNCDDNNDCATIYTWSVENKQACTGTNTSNTMDIFWGWLTKDEFTNQSATYLKQDTLQDCALWQHNSKPLYPVQMNQTVCIKMVAAAASASLAAAAALEGGTGPANDTAPASVSMSLPEPVYVLLRTRRTHHSSTSFLVNSRTLVRCYTIL